MIDATTKVLSCECKHSFQDSRYGRGLRLHNLAMKNSKGKGGVMDKSAAKGWRCTVCGNKKT